MGLTPTAKIDSVRRSCVFDINPFDGVRERRRPSYRGKREQIKSFLFPFDFAVGHGILLLLVVVVAVVAVPGSMFCVHGGDGGVR